MTNPLIEQFKKSVESFDLFWGIAPAGTLKYEKGKAVKSHHIQSTLNLINKMIEEEEGKKKEKSEKCSHCGGRGDTLRCQGGADWVIKDAYNSAKDDTISSLVEFREFLLGELKK